MKRIIVVIAMMMVSCAQAAVSITDFKAHPLSPWGVGVSYNISGALPDNPEIYGLALMVSNRTTKTSYSATALSGDTALTLGVHDVTWDATKDGVSFSSDNYVLTVAYGEKYCVIDLSAGSSATSYPVSYFVGAPSSWSDEYKSTKLVLRYIPAGSFKMQGSTTTTLTKPFYIGVFEVTQKQWELVMGSNPCSSTSYGKGNTYPVHYVSYNMVRGSSNGAQWPSSSSVDADSFIGRLQARTGLNFDLPTEAQWEYACRAGTTTTYSYGDSANGNYMWYTDNSSSSTHPVGSKLPNPWGLYDMHGNVWEWCLDWYGTLAYGTDPLGSSSGSCRVSRGGSWGNSASDCTSSYRLGGSPSNGGNGDGRGFRLSRTLSN